MQYLKNELDRARESLTKRQGYEDVVPLRFVTYQSFLRQLTEYIGNLSNLSVLEVGAGSGVTLALMHKAGAQVTAVDRTDISKEYIGLVSEYFQAHIKYCHADGLELPYRNNSFDLVFNFGVIEHYPPEVQMQLVAEMRRVSSDWVIVGIPNENPDSAYKYFERNVASFSDAFLDEEAHLHADLNEIFLQNNLAVTARDGVGFFLTRQGAGPDFDAPIIKAHRRISSRLPYEYYRADDIDFLVKGESSLTAEERYRFGFLHYLLGNKRPENRNRLLENSF